MKESIQNARFEMRVSPTRLETLELISEKTETDRSELIRRFMDYCCQTPVLNLIFPHLSGSISLERN